MMLFAFLILYHTQSGAVIPRVCFFVLRTTPRRFRSSSVALRGDLIREYVYLNGEPLAQIDESGSSDVLTYLHTDHLSTPRYGTNTGGTQVWAWDSDAFGNGTPTGTATVNLRFPGQYFDNESSLHYNWNRYYSPETGRYTTSNPVGIKGDANSYLYASANPVLFIDPEGSYSYAQTTPSTAPSIAADIAIGVRTVAQVTRSAVLIDIVTPDPSDAVLPKWAGEVVVIGFTTAVVAAIDYCLEGDECNSKYTKAQAKELAYKWAGIDVNRDGDKIFDISIDLTGGTGPNAEVGHERNGSGRSIASVKYHP